MRVVEIAEAEKGYLEKSKANFQKYGVNCLYPKEQYAGSDNLTKYAFETGHKNGEPWCQTFVAWVLMKAYGKEKADELLCKKFASASTMDVKDAMVSAGREVRLYQAKAGDIVYRSRKGGGHVGIVKGWKNGKIVSIEGNSDSDDITSWNGGAVVEHVGANWMWCVRPNYPVADWNWLKDGGYWYYQDENGQNKHGWCAINESGRDIWHWYFFDEKGRMQKGILSDNGKIYYLQEDGDLEGACCLTDDTGAHYIWDLSKEDVEKLG